MPDPAFRSVAMTVPFAARMAAAMAAPMAPAAPVTNTIFPSRSATDSALIAFPCIVEHSSRHVIRGHARLPDHRRLLRHRRRAGARIRQAWAYLGADGPARDRARRARRPHRRQRPAA